MAVAIAKRRRSKCLCQSHPQRLVYCEWGEFYGLDARRGERAL